MLDGLEAGRWELRPREAGAQPQRICLSSGRGLIQLRHAGLVCDRFVVEDTPVQVVVQYTCKGRGYGRTQIQIESQGIASGLPFEFAAEARRIGDC